MFKQKIFQEAIETFKQKFKFSTNAKVFQQNGIF